MKLATSIALIAFTFFNSFSQTNNAVLFSENGERFQVVLNGILQNENPETNVKITGLAANQYKTRILFAEKDLGYIDFNMYFQENGNETTWNIKKNNKEEYVVRFLSTTPIADAKSNSSQQVIIYSDRPATTTTTTTVHSTSSSQATDDVNINMGINTGEGGGSISINAQGPAPKDHTENSTTTVITTTTHSSSVSYEPDPSEYVPGYSGKTGCPVPLRQAEFNSMKESISSKDFEDSKLTIAKQVLRDNCVTASQVKELIQQFDFENTKLEFAKFAYDRTYDRGNFYKVNDAFEFVSSIDDLNRYINSKN